MDQVTIRRNAEQSSFSPGKTSSSNPDKVQRAPPQWCRLHTRREQDPWWSLRAGSRDGDCESGPPPGPLLCCCKRKGFCWDTRPPLGVGEVTKIVHADHHLRGWRPVDVVSWRQ